MADQDNNPLSIGSLFSAFQKKKPEAVEKIAIKLDMEITGVVKNWRHFARELNVAPEVIESLKWYVTFSPTTTVFDNLEFTKPDLTIGTLKEVFTNIGRNDLKRLLDRAFKLEDDGKKVTTALNKVLLSDIALGLDRFGGPTANWEDFAMHEMIGVAKNRGDLQQFGSPLLENPTARIFKLLESKGPQLTLGELYDVLISDSVKRVRTAKRLIDPNVVESSWRSRLVIKVIVPESSLFRKISCDLNRRVPGTGDWKTVAWKLGIPYDDYIRYATCEEKPSPTREVLDKVLTVRPMITISDIVQALEKIERRDVIEIFKEVLGMEDLTGAMRSLTVAMPDKEAAGPCSSTTPTYSQPRVFLSYQWDIKAQVKELKEKLELKRLTCWMDDDDELVPGDNLSEEVKHEISHCKVFISCMTKEYCNSELCIQEATLASEQEKRIIPVLYEGLDQWPPQGPLGIVFSEILSLSLPGGILTDEKFEELFGKIMEFV